MTGKGATSRRTRWIAMRGATLLLLPLLGNSAPEKAVIFEPTPMPIVRAMLALAKVGPPDVVYDLGSGDGRIPMAAAKEYGARGVGVDIDPALIAEARANAKKAGLEDHVHFIEGTMFEADGSGATVVTLFLHPAPNRKLRPTLLAQRKPGSRIVSYIWHMGDWKPDAEQRLRTGVGCIFGACRSGKLPRHPHKRRELAVELAGQRVRLEAIAELGPVRMKGE